MGQSFQVGPWRVEPDLNAISRDGETIHLEPKAVEVLLCLARASGQTVSKDDIVRAVWPDTFVSDDVLSRAICDLRKSFQDDPRQPQYIRTISKRGYRLIAPVRPIEIGPAVALVTPSVSDQSDEQGEPVNLHTGISSSRWVHATAGLLVAMVMSASLLLVSGGKARHRSRAEVQPIRSLAVLPLANVSGNPQQEYFADGMTEELITNIAKIHGLKVISRTSVLQYRQTKKSLPDIARELEVDGIIEGSVLLSGNRVRVTANLLHGPTDRHLWANSYERDLQDVLALQGEVARDIAEQVRIKITPDELARINVTRTVKPEALQAYLQGRYALTRIWGSGIPGIDHFRRATELDPTYAEAYVGLCLAYLQMGFGYGPLSPSEAFAESKRAALRALEIDPHAGDAHACLAWVTGFHEWDWPAAESAFQRAIELSPNSVQAHRLYSRYLSATRRHKEAISESEFARTLDPASPATLYAAGSAYWYAKQFHRAGEIADTIEKIDPNFPGASYLWGLVDLETGDFDDAVLRLQKAIRLSGDPFPVWYVGILGSAYARAGQRSEALDILEQLQEASKTRYVSPYVIAILYSNLGQTREALDSLERAYTERNPMIATLQVEQLFDETRSQPRFQSLLRRMNFPK